MEVFLTRNENNMGRKWGENGEFREQKSEQ
jgi:hypothetical protein